MVTTDNEELYQKMKLLKGQGMDPTRRYWHLVVGYNYRMTNIQAAVGLGQLENSEWHLAQRVRVADLYEKHLGKHNELIKMQKVPEGYTSVYWMNNVILQETVKKDRDDVMREMDIRNIETRPVFYPMHNMPPYYEERDDLYVAERLAARGISLPSHALLTEDDVCITCESLLQIVG